MSFNSMVQWFLPKEDKFFLLLEKQGEVLYKAASTLSDFSNKTVSNDQISKSVQDIEHEGDDLVQTLEEELAKTFVTSIDREDIHQLSTEMDDVIDFCNSAARVCVLYGVEHPTEPMTDLMKILVSCATEIHSALPSLRSKNYSKFLETKRAVKLLEKNADSVYRNAVSSLFHSDINYKSFISQKSVLEKLESAVDRCDDIACALANLAIKHA